MFVVSVVKRNPNGDGGSSVAATALVPCFSARSAAWPTARTASGNLAAGELAAAEPPPPKSGSTVSVM